MARIAFVLTGLQLGASAATFVQQVFVARVLGATQQTDGYQIALALVLFIAQALIAGALVNAFVPRLASLAREDIGRSRAYAFWAQINIVAVASGVTVLLWIATPTVVSVTVAGLSPVAQAWTVESLRIMVFAIPIAALNGVYTSSLYASGDLAFAAFAQIVQNAVAAAVSVIGYTFIGFTALPLSLVLGTFAGSVTLFLRLHQRSLTPNRAGPHLRVPSASILGVTAGPLVVPVVGAVPGFVERWFMSFFPVGQVAILAYAGRIFSVAIAFGVSVGVVALASWSGDDAQDHDSKGGAATSRSAVTAVLFTLLPATVALIVMPDVLIQALFNDSALDRSQLSTMSFVLAIYSLSLLPLALIGVIMRGFYAVGDARGALNATAIWALVWVLFDVALVPPYGIYGLATASVVAVWITLFIVFIRWRREPWLAVWPATVLSRETLVMALASVVSVTVASEILRRLSVPWALAAIPLVVVAYVAMSAAGGSGLARDIAHSVDRRH